MTTTAEQLNIQGFLVVGDLRRDESVDTYTPKYEQGS